MIKEEIIKRYLADLKNIVSQSPARDQRISLLEDELKESENKEKELEEYIWENINIPLCETDKVLQTDNYKKYLNAVKWAKFGLTF